MKPKTRATLIFASIYAALAISGIFLLFAWGSFGGGANLNTFQKVIWAFLAYPADLILDQSSIWVYFLLKTAFWTLMFYLAFSAWQYFFKRSMK